MNTTLESLAPVWTPHPGQREFLENTAQFKVLACGRRWGKTDACAAQIITSLFRESPSRHVIVAPTQDQANLLFDRVLDLLEQMLGKGTRKSKDLKLRRTPYPRLKFGTHSVTARSGHLARSLRGNEATDLVIDEAAFVPESLITEVAMPMLATTNGRLTLISTPNGKNHFWRFFQFGQEGKHGVWSRAAPSTESPFVSRSFLDVQRDLISDRAYRIEYLAEFVDSVGQMFRTEAVEACVVERLPAVEGPVIIGIDWARYHDVTAVAVIQGDQSGAVLRELHTLAHEPWRVQISQVARIIHSYDRPMVVSDATGGGDALVEMLRDEVRGFVKPFVFSATSKPPLIENLVALVEREALAMTPHPVLLREMHHFEATETESGHRRMSAPSGMHDDHVIALALAASELKRPYGVPVRTGKSREFSRNPQLNRRNQHA